MALPKTKRRAPDKTPQALQKEVEAIPNDELARREALDDPTNPSITPVAPQCRKCGATFSTDAELLDHAKTCKGGHQPMGPAGHRQGP
jgi:hypothetical protein